MADLDQKDASMPVYLVGAEADGTETTPVKSTATGDLRVTDSLSLGGVQGAITVGVSAVSAKVGVSNYSGRKMLTVMPTDGSVFWGYTDTVTTSTGTEIFRNQMATFKVEDTVSVWLVAAANRNVRVTEGK